MDRHVLTGNCSTMKPIAGTSVDDLREGCVMQQWTPPSTPLTQPLLQQITVGNTNAEHQMRVAIYAVGLFWVIGFLLTYLCRWT